MTPTATIGHLRQQPWRHWSKQVLAVLGIELRKSFLTRRGFFIYLLAFAPVLLILLHAVMDAGKVRDPQMHVAEDTPILAVILQLYYVRFAIFFGCMGIFTWLVRGEVVEKTLHYYFLAPMRRELLIVGKFLSGAIAAIVMFGAGMLACFLAMYWHIGPVGRDYMLHGVGASQLAHYMLMMAMACIGFGSAFLALSLLFRNPIVPAAILMGWESISPVLPALLQKLTISFYLKQLAPVELPQQGLAALFNVVTEPLPAPVAILGVLTLTAGVLVFAAWRTRRMEISYATD